MTVSFSVLSSLIGRYWIKTGMIYKEILHNKSTHYIKDLFIKSKRIANIFSSVVSGRNSARVLPLYQYQRYTVNIKKIAKEGTNGEEVIFCSATFVDQ